MIRIISCTSMDEYNTKIFNNTMEVDSVYKCGKYAEGHRYGSDATIVGVYIHNESNCAWIVIQHDDGQLFEIDVPCLEPSYTRWGKYYE